MIEDSFGGREIAEVEGSELAESGAGRVVPHRIDDLLEELGIASPEGHPPFPIVESDRGGYELCDFAGEGHAALCMFGHHFGTRGEWLEEPICSDISGFVHGVEAHCWPRGKLWCKALSEHHRESSFVGCNFCLERGCIGIFAAADEFGCVLFFVREVFADFGHGDKRVGWHEGLSESCCEETLVGAVDAEWIGIHQDHAEICFVSCDDKELHALWAIVQVA